MYQNHLEIMFFKKQCISSDSCQRHPSFDAVVDPIRFKLSPHNKMSLVSRVGGCEAKQCQHAKAWKVLGNPLDFNDSQTEHNALENKYENK